MKKISLFLISFCLLATSAFGQLVDPSTPLAKDPAVRYGKLDNGLTYYIRHNDKPAQRAEFYLVTNVGAIQETEAQSGLAHFLEHMCLNGTKNLPGNMLIDYFQTVGVEFGRNINAGTGVEQTSYMLNNIPVIRQGIIDTSLLIMHDYSHFVTNDPVEIDKERGVIVEEWRTRRNASWRMHEQELPYLYKDSQYAKCTLIGSKENLETFPPEELVKFYKTWYRPDLQALIVVGDINVDAIEAQIKELFADIPAQENPQPKIMPTVPDNAEPIVGIISDPEATNNVTTIYVKSDPLPDEYMPLGAAYLTDMVESLITRMLNERFDDISKQPNAPFIVAATGMGKICRTKDAFIVQVISKDNEAVPAFTAALTEVEKAKRFGFTEAEYERAKTNMLRVLERAKDNAESRKNAEFVDLYTMDFLYGNPYMTPEYEYNLAKGYASIMPLEQINMVFKQMNVTTNSVVIYKGIEKEGNVHPTEQQILDSMASVATAEIAAPTAEEILEPLVDASALKGSPVKKTKAGAFGTTEWTLKNGIKVIVLPTDYNKEEILFSIENQGGRSLVATEDLASIEGNLFSMYTEYSGLSNFPSTKLTKMLTGKAVYANPYIDDLAQGVSGQTSPKDLETLLQLTYLFYTAPRFVESEFQPALDQISAIVPNIVKQPNFQFQTETMKILYPNCPRQAQYLISPEVLANFKFATLEKVYRQLFSNAAGSTVTFVGNVNIDELKPLVEKYIGSLPVAKKAPSWVDDNENIVKGTFAHPFEVEMTTPKTTYCMVVSGDMKYTAENIVLMNATTYILDLLYTKTIREDAGGTYGVSPNGTLNPLPKGTFLLQIAFDTDPAKAANLVQIAKDGLDDLAKNGPTEDQVAKAKENFLKNLPENRISNSYWKRNISALQKYGIDRDTDYANIVNGLTVEKIKNYIAGMLNQGNIIDFQMNPAPAAEPAK